MADSAVGGERPDVRDTAVSALKFQALAGDLRRGILAGEWAGHGKLPTESRLAAETGLSLTTVRRAYDELVTEGLVVRRRGAGTFVIDRTAAVQRGDLRIGVLVPDAQLYYPRVLQGIDDALSAAGAGMQLATYHYDLDEEQADLLRLLDSGVHGLLLAPDLLTVDDPAARAAELTALPVPVVLMERRLAGTGPADTSEHVTSDHQGGAFDAVVHLHRLGHHRIALLTRSHGPTQDGVRSGYEAAVRALGLPDLQRCEPPVWNRELAAECIDTLTDAEATAALIFSDREATLVLGAARRRGLRVPEDLALVSYDDELADVADVPLTAVAPPKYRVGRMAAEVLLRRLIDGDAGPIHQIQLRPRVVVRQSCGART
ncbi:GntR family transcriptional regulator [Ruania alba]|uniref:DNA-binding transcriptional regulator, LacI/PurR family n=1 Tax=Ruania alba TaxID=648782 RepID=A0A1H5K9Y7_9MICO|nr:GntR family transcriptional regulator [Ruania alba]SEE61615.1 DNA-binding transcriptional regulator, LacI/PurR family [Ruania alba]